MFYGFNVSKSQVKRKFLHLWDRHLKNIKKTKKKQTKNKKLFDESAIWLLFRREAMGKTKKPRETKNQKNKTFQRMFGLRLMFGFFWFSSSFLRFFGHDLEKTKKTQGFLFFWKNSSKTHSIMFWYWCCNYVFPLLSPYIEKNTFHYRPLASTISLRKRLSQKYVRQFFSNFFLWRPDFFKGK